MTLSLRQPVPPAKSGIRPFPRYGAKPPPIGNLPPFSSAAFCESCCLPAWHPSPLLQFFGYQYHRFESQTPPDFAQKSEYRFFLLSTCPSPLPFPKLTSSILIQTKEADKHFSALSASRLTFILLKQSASLCSGLVNLFHFPRF